MKRIPSDAVIGTLDFLRIFCDGVSQIEPRKVGRPRVSTPDVVFVMASRVLAGLTAREASAVQSPYQLPAYNTILRYMGMASMTRVLSDLVDRTSDESVEMSMPSAWSSEYVRFESKWLPSKSVVVSARVNHNWLTVRSVSRLRSAVPIAKESEAIAELKSVFGGHVVSKTDVSCFNEVLLKCVCHNVLNAYVYPSIDV